MHKRSILELLVLPRVLDMWSEPLVKNVPCDILHDVNGRLHFAVIRFLTCSNEDLV